MGHSKKNELSSLRGVGSAALADFRRLGIRSLEQLRRSNAQELYDELYRVTDARHDPCVLDVFSCAIAQAANPNLPEEQRDWWYWTKIRKAQQAGE